MNIPEHQERMMGRESRFRLAASSYSGALLTIGTRVQLHDREHSAASGEIRAIRENPDGGEVFVLWPDGHFDWRHARNLDRVGRAVRGPV